MISLPRLPTCTALAALSTALLLACGSHITLGSGGGVGGAAGAGASTGAGGGCADTSLPCERAPSGDEMCADQGAGTVHFVCYGMAAVSSACSYAVVCDTCFSWCCPPEPWQAPSYADLDNGTGGDGPAAAGCARQPADDYACRAQLAPPLAVYCPGLDSHDMPAGCTGNSYGANSCRTAAEGYFCCALP